jgi:hypothetical protein
MLSFIYVLLGIYSTWFRQKYTFGHDLFPYYFNLLHKNSASTSSNSSYSCWFWFLIFNLTNNFMYKSSHTILTSYKWLQVKYWMRISFSQPSLKLVITILKPTFQIIIYSVDMIFYSICDFRSAFVYTKAPAMTCFKHIAAAIGKLRVNPLRNRPIWVVTSIIAAPIYGILCLAFFVVLKI